VIIGSIIKGHFNELLGREQSLSESRLLICKNCPLYKASPVGRICDPTLYVNTHTNEVSDKPQEGYYKGCNCRLEAKTRDPEAHCPAKKW